MSSPASPHTPAGRSPSLVADLGRRGRVVRRRRFGSDAQIASRYTPVGALDGEFQVNVGMAYTGMAYTVTAETAAAYTVTADIVMVRVVTANIV